jgi:hypothetical protein
MLRGFEAWSRRQCGVRAGHSSRTRPDAPDAGISGVCNQVSGTFLNGASARQHDYFRLSLPAGQTVTALPKGLTVD